MSDSQTPEPGSIVWMDLTVPDAAAIKDFYAAVAGWTAAPHDMGEYHDFDIKLPGSGRNITGICYARGPNANLPAQWLIYIAVTDVDASAARCVELGGKVLDGPRSMGSSRYCVIQDPAGAVAALFQAQMNAEQTPFRPGWYGFDLGAYRPCDGTYCLYPYESLPLLPEERFRGDFAWLSALDAALDGQMEVYRPPQAARERMGARVGQLAMAARSLGLTLPAPFVGFMGAVDLQARIPSCTACYFDLPGRIVPCPGRDDAYLVRFLNDQQDVLMWYLYCNRAGDHCVVVSPVYFDDEPLAPEVAAAVGDYGFYCAPGFEAFVYRFWLENRIWFAMSEGDKALTKEMRAYLEHYGSARRQAE